MSMNIGLAVVKCDVWLIEVTIAMRTCQQRIPKFNARANAAKTYKHLLSV